MIKQHIFWIDAFDPKRKQWEPRVMSFVRNISSEHRNIEKAACIQEAARLMRGFQVRCQTITVK
jgi:hypothetical protein